MKAAFNAEALKAYQSRSHECIPIGVSKFDSLEDALVDANENIARYTKSDFAAAWFYEGVKAEVLRQMGLAK